MTKRLRMSFKDEKNMGIEGVLFRFMIMFSSSDIREVLA